MAARQNGVIAVLPVVFFHDRIILLSIDWPLVSQWSANAVHFRGPPSRRGVRSVNVVSAASTLVVLLAFAGSQWVIEYHVIHAKRTYPQQQLFEGDLANMSLRTGQVLLPSFVFPAQNLDVLHQHDSPFTALPLLQGAGHPLVRSAHAAPWPAW